MTNQKKIMAIIVGVAILILLAGGWYWLTGRDGKTVVPGDGGEQSGGSAVIEQPGGGLGQGAGEGQDLIGAVLSDEDKEKIAIKNRAKFFTAMIGSYSTDARFQNIIDLEPMMTDKMKVWADDFIQRNQASLEEEKERVLTMVFAVDIIEYSGARAAAIVETRRQESGSPDSTIYNQQAKLEMVKRAGNWLVDSIEWQ